MHMISYLTLTHTMHLSCIIFKLQQVICQKSPPAFGTPIGGDPVQFCRDLRRQKLESHGYRVALFP